MTTSLEAEAALRRLAHVLGVEPNALGFLRGCDVAALRELRASVSDHLLRAGRKRYERLRVLAQALPTPLAAQLAEHALGARLSAHVASLLDGGQTAEFAHRLPPGFLADIASLADPRFLAPHLSGIHEDKLLAIATILIEREEWVAIAALVDASSEVSGSAIFVISAQSLLQIGFFMEDQARIREVFRQMPDSKLGELLTAADSERLLAIALHLIAALDDAGLRRVGGALGQLDPERQASLAQRLSVDPGLLRSAQGLLAHSPPAVRAAVNRSSS